MGLSEKGRKEFIREGLSSNERSGGRVKRKKKKKKEERKGREGGDSAAD